MFPAPRPRKPSEPADQEQQLPDRPWKRKWLPKPVDSSGQEHHRHQAVGSETKGAGRYCGFGNDPPFRATLHLDLIDQPLRFRGHFGQLLGGSERVVRSFRRVLGSRSDPGDVLGNLASTARRLANIAGDLVRRNGLLFYRRGDCTGDVIDRAEEVEPARPLRCVANQARL